MSQSGSYNSGGGGGGSVTTLTGNTGGAVSASAGNINVVGSGGVTVTGNPGTHTLTITSSGGGGGITTLDGDSGSATGTTVTLAGGSNINTSATSATVTFNLDNTVSISGSMTAGTGFTATTGDVTITAGNINLPSTNSAGTQGTLNIDGTRFLSSDGVTGTGVCLGQNAGNITVDMGSSVAIGSIALASMNGDGGQNVAVGANSLTTLTSGSINTAVGLNSLLNLATGNFNIGIGDNAGSAYTTSESANIAIGTSGVVGDNNVMRLGDTGVITSSFVAGAYGVTPGSSPQMMIVGSDGELGSQALPAAAFTWSEQTGTTQAMVVNHGYILNNAGLVTATLPATAALGSVMEIVGKGAGGWLLAQNSGQTVHFGNQDTTTGTGGSLASTNQYDCITILCITANTDFIIKSSIGNLTVS